MDTENSTDNRQPSIINQLLLAVPPVLLIAVGYVDPGKWAAAVEGGVRFGSDLVLLMLVFNFAAILCQYLSARIAVVTGRDLSKICCEEYDNTTCIFLGVLAELSLIALDFTMILGAANELNLIFGADLFTSVFFTAIGAVIFPVLASILENGKVKLVCVSTASFILLLYALGVLLSQPEISISTSLTPTKLSGDSVFALMSLLGANIIPHNFYLHSSLVQQELGPLNVSMGVLCHNHFFAILCIFSGLFLVNYVLMNAAANMYYSTDFGSLTFQDALSLIQVFRSSTIPLVFLLVLYVSSQITSLTWNLGRQAILHDFFGMDIPGWLHHATIRIIAIIPALYCVWNAGAEDVYQLLIVTQVVVALMLPCSVIPLVRVASSRSVMGVYKISQFVEFLALIMFFGMLGLKIIFLVEMIFGNSYWDSNLRWNVGSYVVLLITAFTSLCLMIWLAATPLKSATSILDAHVQDWDIKDIVAETSAEKEEIDFYETRQRHDRGEPLQKQIPALELDKFSASKSNISVTSANLNLPEPLLDLDNIPQLTTIAEEGSNDMQPSPSVSHPVEPATAVETVVASTFYSEVSAGESADIIASNTKSTGLLVDRTPSVQEDLQIGKDERDNWDPEESLKVVSGSSASLTSEGPGSYRSVSGKNDDSGSGAGSLSRLAGLGRAGRRQLAVFLAEFWGQLFDLHGEATQESQAKKLDLLLGLDSKVDPKAASPLKVTSAKEFTGYISSVSGKGFGSPINSSVYDSTKPLGVQDSLKTCVVQRGSSSSWSSRMQLLDAHVQNASHSALDSSERRYSSLQFPASSDSMQNSCHNALESSERRYSSLRFPQSSDAVKNYSHSCLDSSERRYSSLQFPLSSDSMQNSSHNALDPSERRYSSLRFRPSSDINDYQPATVHGYMIASHLRQIAKESSDYLNGPVEGPILRSPSLGTSKYKDPIAFASGRKLQNGLSTPPGFSKPVVSRNISMQSGRPFNDLCSPGPAENVNAAVNAKKFQSLPDISELSLRFRDAYGQSLYSSTSSRAGAPLAYDIRSPSKPYSDPYTVQFSSSSDTGSLWSTQPFEQFGVADKTFAIGGGVVGHKQSSLTQDITTVMDLEAKLLQSFRHCIMKLLNLEGSDWLFRQNDGADEDLIDRVAARERFLYEAETREMNQVGHPSDPQHSFDRKPDSALKNDGTDVAKSLASSVPHCGEGCVWRADLIISFGVWCIHRIMELSLMESRPELWGKYTYVLNHLQGIIDLAFSKPRTSITPCFCLQIPAADQQKLSPRGSGGSSLPPPARQGRGKCTSSAMLLDMIKDVEIAISCRKGRTGTAAGDAFSMGKENLVSVLKRYKRRLINKPVGAHEGGIGSARVSSPSPYC